MPPMKSSGSSPKSGPTFSKQAPGPSTSRSESSTSNAESSKLKFVLSKSKSGPTFLQPYPSISKSEPSFSYAVPSTSRAESSTLNFAFSTSNFGFSSFKFGAPKSRFGPVTSMYGPCPSYAGPSYKPVRTKGDQFMDLLQRRERGMVQPEHFTQTAWQMKIEDFKRVTSRAFGSSRNESNHTAYFLRAGRNTLIAAWYAELDGRFTSVVAQLPYDLSKVVVGRTAFATSPYTVIDACQIYANPNIFAYLSYDRYRRGILTLAAPEPDDNREICYFPYTHPHKKAYHCINSNLYTRRFAVGLDKEVNIYCVTGIQEYRLLKDNVYGLAYNKKGTVLYMGCQKGDLALYDLRSIGVKWRMRRLDDNILDDVTVLADGNHVLVSGPSGKLMLIDVRNKKKILDFPSHNRRSRKIPVSVNEKFELVSCTGVDDITRLWSLRSGELLHSFGSPSTYPARSCFIPHSSRGQIHLVQDNYIHVYGMLR